MMRPVFAVALAFAVAGPAAAQDDFEKRVAGKTAADANKNIQILTTLPASELFPTFTGPSSSACSTRRSKSPASRRLGRRARSCWKGRCRASGWSGCTSIVKSGLLVRRVTLTPTSLGRIPEQTDYEDYRAIGPGGTVKLPFVVRRNTATFSNTQKYDEIKLNVPVDPTLFRKPTP